MKANELLAITKKAIAKRNDERPEKLYLEILPSMRDEAERGYSHFSHAFSDPPEVVEKVLARLEKEGYHVTRNDGPKKNLTKISWEKAVDEQCQFDIAWVGRCKQTADKTGFCDEHKKEKCRCGKQAVKSCDATIGAFVCGATTCGRCSHHH